MTNGVLQTGRERAVGTQGVRADDFRSDLVSTFPAGMAQAIFASLSAPAAFGHREDIHQAKLEARLAEMFGFSDALLVPTCTLANQIALRVWSERGHQTVVADQYSHLATVEAFSTKALNNVTMDLLQGVRGHLSPRQIEQRLGSASRPLIWLENTHMACGGTVMPPQWLADISQASRTYGVPIHIDGSRIWNAVVRNGASPAETVKGAHSLSLSLNKALGALAGAMLLGDQDFIRSALEFRSVFGGSWRRTGLISAAALHALVQYEPRIENDHSNAGALAGSLRIANQSASAVFEIDDPDSNIVLIRASRPSNAEALVEFLRSRNVLTLHIGNANVRVVVHAGTEKSAIQNLTRAFSEFMEYKSKEPTHESAQ